MGELKAPIGPNTAHLCIDMQRLFSDEGPWPMAWTDPLRDRPPPQR